MASQARGPALVLTALSLFALSLFSACGTSKSTQAVSPKPRRPQPGAISNPTVPADIARETNGLRDYCDALRLKTSAQFASDFHVDDLARIARAIYASLAPNERKAIQEFYLSLHDPWPTSPIDLTDQGTQIVGLLQAADKRAGKAASYPQNKDETLGKEFGGGAEPLLAVSFHYQGAPPRQNAPSIDRVVLTWANLAGSDAYLSVSVRSKDGAALAPVPFSKFLETQLPAKCSMVSSGLVERELNAVGLDEGVNPVSSANSGNGPAS